MRRVQAVQEFSSHGDWEEFRAQARLHVADIVDILWHDAGGAFETTGAYLVTVDGADRYRLTVQAVTDRIRHMAELPNERNTLTNEVLNQIRQAVTEFRSVWEGGRVVAMMSGPALDDSDFGGTFPNANRPDVLNIRRPGRSRLTARNGRVEPEYRGGDVLYGVKTPKAPDPEPREVLLKGTRAIRIPR